MKRLSAKFHIAFGQTCLVLSLMLTALYLGLVPDRQAAIREGRAALVEAIAANSSRLIGESDLQRLESTLKLAVSRNEGLLSAAVRQVDGEAAITIGDHHAYWNNRSKTFSTESQVQVAMWKGKTKWGHIEFRFRPLSAPGWRGWLQQPWLQLLAFISLASFVIFYLYLSKMLRHLDPSQAIPDRVRSALDTLAEGLLVVDREGYIVLANQAFASVIGKAPNALLGLRADGFSWSTSDRTPIDKQAYPWVRVLQEGTPQTSDRLYLDDSESNRRTFKVNCSPVLGDDAKAGGALVSFDDRHRVGRKRSRVASIERRSRSGQPCQERLPRQYESRDSHPDECHPRFYRSAQTRL
ncbi:MAG: hypothetical protein ETSY2_50610 [Candidatus Entotheonella gemina]|uniref:PAS domain-containing protein n=1 Tax=Candidatus Entotheonella gemina TaxID=1429439 RepID=W4L794_9BACT|nr:MAG: hypothetical protein ETSY2_50610 [Candidatus Entotheonella gemina]